MQQKLLCSIWCLVMLFSGPEIVQALSITVYVDRPSWEGALSGTFFEESFGDEILNTEITVVSDMGIVDTGNGRWWDRTSTTNNWSTTFNFSSEIFAFGGEWDLAGPSGPGQGLLVSLPYSTGSTLLSIDRSNPGQFWGFVSDTAFSSVTIQGWRQSGWAETYEMDNLVYSVSSNSNEPVPEPGTWLLFLSGIVGLIVWRIWSGPSKQFE